MDPSQIRDGASIQGIENTKYESKRMEKMNLRPLGMYGIPKVQFDKDKIFPGTCLGCAFGEEGHNCGR